MDNNHITQTLYHDGYNEIKLTITKTSSIESILDFRAWFSDGKSMFKTIQVGERYDQVSRIGSVFMFNQLISDALKYAEKLYYEKSGEDNE